MENDTVEFGAIRAKIVYKKTGKIHYNLNIGNCYSFLNWSRKFKGTLNRAGEKNIVKRETEPSSHFKFWHGKCQYPNKKLTCFNLNQELVAVSEAQTSENYKLLL